MMFFLFFFFSGCTDKLDASVCKVFASSGSCDSLYNYTSVQCAKTCGFCGGKKILLKVLIEYK